MTVFVESLRRLNIINKVTLEKVKELLNNKKIVAEEYFYIIGKDDE